MKKLVVLLILVFVISTIYCSYQETIHEDFNLNTLNIPFIKNNGQVGNINVDYYAHTFSGIIYVEKDGILSYNLIDGEGQSILIKEKITHNLFSTFAEKPSISKINYFKGNNPEKWKTKIPAFNEIFCPDIYEGINLTLKAYAHNVEKVFTITPGTNPDIINITITGINKLEITDDKQLSVNTDLGSVQFSKPVAYQIMNDCKEFVEVEYILVDETTYGFSVGYYRFDLPLIIDPLLASTFIGGSENDLGLSDVGVDSNGNIFIAGRTESSDYPADANDNSYNGGSTDACILHFKSYHNFI